MNLINQLSGAEQVVKWFGYMPNFHDAEVVSFLLRRSTDCSLLKVSTSRSLDEVDAEGNYRRDKHAVVVFSIFEISALEIRDWNHQNVLSRVEVHDCPDGYAVRLSASFGIDGEIVAKKITLSVEPLTDN